MNTPRPIDENGSNKSLIESLEYQEYYLIQHTKIYKITIGINNNCIIINHKQYTLNINSSDLFILTNIEFNTNHEAYDFIIKLFEENMVTIKQIKLYQSLVLSLKLFNENIIEMILTYNINNESFILNSINNLIKEIQTLKEENKNLKYEINKIQKQYIFPQKIKLKTEVTKDSYAHDNSDNSFATFKTINNEFFMIYSTKNKSIICYDLEKEKKVKEIKNCHNKYITNFRYYLDDLNKRDLIMSISYEDNNLKIWDITGDFKCILDLKNVNQNGKLYSACFLYDNNNNYIVTSNLNYRKSESIKIFDFNGNKIKEINDSNYDTFFIDTYYDNILSTNYIITGNPEYVKSYNYNKNKIYNKYYDNNNSYHVSVIIKKNEEKIKLIESCNDGNIRIWNFHTGDLLNKIKISDEYLYGICLIEEYLYVGCEEKTIKIIELSNGKIINQLKGHNNYVINIKNIIHPQYGVCLLSQGYKNDQIKIWN